MNNNTYRAIASLTFIAFVSIASTGCSDSVTPTSPEPMALGYQYGETNNLNTNDNCDPAVGNTCTPANPGSNGNNGNNNANGSGVGTQDTSVEILAAMALGIQDEYHAENVYQASPSGFRASVSFQSNRQCRAKTRRSHRGPLPEQKPRRSDKRMESQQRPSLRLHSESLCGGRASGNRQHRSLR